MNEFPSFFRDEQSDPFDLKISFPKEDFNNF